MPETPKTSFIPKNAMGAMPGRAPRRRKHFNVFSFIGIVIFLCGIILTIGVYVYKDISEKDLASKKAELQAIKTSFSQSDIENLRELDRRINVANALLDQHLSPSVVFDMLEVRTQEGTQFTEFSYERRESGSVEITMGGSALRFNTVALQSRQLANAAALQSAIFSDVNIGEGQEGAADTVDFTVTAQADTEALTYTAFPVADTSETAIPDSEVVGDATSTDATDGDSLDDAQTDATSTPVTPNTP